MRSLSQFLTFVALVVFCVSKNFSLADSKWNPDAKEKATTLLDVSRDYIQKAKSLYPKCDDGDSKCEQKQALAFLDVAMNLITQVKTGYPVSHPEPECSKQQPVDCSDVLRNGDSASGVYSIWPRSRIASNNPISVYCDMDTDGGGWTVIQRRGKFSTPKDYFYKNWADYKTGFGDITEEFWIGNDNIFAITSQANYSIRFDLKDHKGETGYAVYSTFWIDDEAADYTLHIDGYSGNVGDAMEFNNEMKFSTKDRDNDNNQKKSCAVERQGAWWYNVCAYANLNGINNPGANTPAGIIWFHWKKTVLLAAVDMKLRSA